MLDRASGTQPEGRPVALIIDEFSALMAYSGITAEGQIRAAVQTHQNLGYIFSGSNVQLMMDMTGTIGPSIVVALTSTFARWTNWAIKNYPQKMLAGANSSC